tara:strand:- start:12807 stop:13229 length:423 start_codon:yes stop_codon:yes gene_type:complete
MPKSKKRKFIRYFLLLFWISVFSWQFYQMNASGFKDSVVLTSDEKVTFVETKDYICFRPKEDSINTSLLFFPGALVEPEAYAPLSRELAEQGYSVHIQKITFNLSSILKTSSISFKPTSIRSHSERSEEPAQKLNYFVAM